MTDTPLEPLWSDEDIITQYKEAFGENLSENAWQFIVSMRDEYEEERATLLDKCLPNEENFDAG